VQRVPRREPSTNEGHPSLVEEIAGVNEGIATNAGQKPIGRTYNHLALLDTTLPN